MKSVSAESRSRRSEISEIFLARKFGEFADPQRAANSSTKFMDPRLSLGRGFVRVERDIITRAVGDRAGKERGGEGEWSFDSLIAGCPEVLC